MTQVSGGMCRYDVGLKWTLAHAAESCDERVYFFGGAGLCCSNTGYRKQNSCRCERLDMGAQNLAFLLVQRRSVGGAFLHVTRQRVV